MKHFTLPKSKWSFLVIGLLVGAVIILGIRFVTYSKPQTHYHANFAVYINGQREEFKGPQYYEEIAACTTNGPIQPAQRAHMHDGINSVIHVHDDGVTWDQFFENIGWYLGPNFIQDDKGNMYVENGDNKLNLVLNGQNLTDLTSLSNVVIKDEDRLLVSFGDINKATLDTEFKSVPSTAHHYDVTPDPASCAGQMGKVTAADRFKHLF